MSRAILLLVVLGVVGACVRTKDRETIRALVAEVTPRLEAQRSVVGTVVVHGDEVELLDGNLALVIRVLHDEADAAAGNSGLLHLHVLATPRDRAAGRIDLCLFGFDAAAIARLLIEHALPPVLSAILDTPVLGTTHAWADTEHAIQGHSAYLGLYYTRGKLDQAALSSLLDSAMFDDLPSLPADGRIHLLKAVFSAKGGAWFRTIELDGAPAVQSEHRLAAASTVVGGLVAFAILDGKPDPRGNQALRDDARRRLAARPPWLPDPGTCPATLIPKTLVSKSLAASRWDSTGARGGRLLHAVRGCEAGEVSSCYVAAQELIVEDRASPIAQSLFLRACQLGDASACTNAAAAREPQDACAFAAYEASCDRGGDPWGCTMLGGALVQGDAKDRDLARARNVLAKACVLGNDDPACEAATRILKSIDARPPTTPR